VGVDSGNDQLHVPIPVRTLSVATFVILASGYTLDLHTYPYVRILTHTPRNLSTTWRSLKIA